MRVLSLSRDSIPCEFATRLAADAALACVKAERAGGDPRAGHAPGLYAFLAAGKELAAVDQASLPALIARCDAVVADEWGRGLMAGFTAGKPLIVVGERDSAALAGVPVGRC